MNTRLDYLWEKVSLFTQFSDLAKIFEPIFFKISLKTGPIFDHPLLVKIGSEIRKSVQNRKTDIFSSPGADPYQTAPTGVASRVDPDLWHLIKVNTICSGLFVQILSDYGPIVLSDMSITKSFG